VQTLEGQHTVHKLNFHTTAFGTSQLRNRKEVQGFQGVGVRILEEQKLDSIVDGTER